MADYSADILGAYESIKDAGASIQVQRVTKGAFLPATDTYASSTTATDSTYGVFTNYKHSHIDGTRIKVGDMKLLIPAYGLAATIQPGNQIIHGSDTWEVKDPGMVAPNGVPIIYKAQVRNSG